MITPLHDILRFPLIFWRVESAHQWSAVRLRAKLWSDSNEFAVEAERLTEAAFGPEVQFQGGDDDAYTEWAERGHFAKHQQRLLERSESYLWGLGIAGIYHQFERDVRGVVGVFTTPALNDYELHKADFKHLCDYVERLGYSIRQSSAFADVDVGRLISNAIKHGEGPSCSNLASKRPDLFTERRAVAGYRKAKIRLNVDDLRVGVAEFDQVVLAISTIWPELKAAVSASNDHEQERTREGMI